MTSAALLGARYEHLFIYRQQRRRLETPIPAPLPPPQQARVVVPADLRVLEMRLALG
jgi:hypothetical protein